MVVYSDDAAVGENAPDETPMLITMKPSPNTAGGAWRLVLRCGEREADRDQGWVGLGWVGLGCVGLGLGLFRCRVWRGVSPAVRTVK